MEFDHLDRIPETSLYSATFFERDPREVARDLLGQCMVSNSGGELTGGLIVETEAYLSSDDTASHSVRGPTKKNRSMFGQPGIGYVYVIHARHCFNVVTESSGIGSAVLIRALQPTWGVEQIRERRLNRNRREWTTGPARLCEALAIDRSLDGDDLTCKGGVWLQPSSIARTSIDMLTTPRIGVTSAKELPYRYLVPNCDFASGPKRLRQ